jgi:phosphatidylinositol alpha-mannosyltransferase
MKIAVVCPYSVDEPGGVQQQAIGLVEELRAIGREAWLVAPGTMGPSETKLIGGSVRVRANGSMAPIALHPAAVGKTRRAVRGADLVHIHEPLMFLTSPAAYLGTDAPAVGTFHADPSTRIRAFYRLAGPVLRRVFSRLQAVTAVSEAAASAVRHLVGELSLIPNAIDVGAFALQGERRSNRVAFLGRDEPRKGLDVLLAAWPMVRAAVNDAELVVLGVDRGGQNSGIRYLGRIVGLEKGRQLAQAGIYCAPNLGGESFGITLLEAMAAGCAPVVSDLEPFRQVAGSVARYAAVADPQSLANQLIEALRDRRESERQGEAARQAAAAYDWRHVLPRYLELYERVRR